MKAQRAAVDAYIRSFSPATQALLEKLRATIRAVAPAATERISYRIPSFFFNGALVYYAAYARHLGLYGARSAFRAYARELAPYRSGESTLRFALDQPLPLGLIRKVVKLRVNENAAEAKSRAMKSGTRRSLTASATSRRHKSTA